MVCFICPFEFADMIGIDGHVSFLHQKKEKKEKEGVASLEGFFLCVCVVCVWKKSLHAHRCQSYQQFERQIKQTTEEFRVHSTSYDKGSCFAMA